MQDVISGLAGVFLSLIFSYVPKAKDWFESLDGVHKRLVMAGLCALVVGLMFGLACAGYAEKFGVAATCDEDGAVALLKLLGTALAANQVTFLLSPKQSQG